MIGPIKRLKIAWYKHQATRAIWFLRYIDTIAHSVGWNRTQVRQMWRDLVERPHVRQTILDQLAVANGIKVMRANRSKLQISHDILYGKLVRLHFENERLKERLGELPVEFVEGLILAIDNCESIDGLLADYGVTIEPAQEAKNEVPAM